MARARTGKSGLPAVGGRWHVPGGHRQAEGRRQGSGRATFKFDGLSEANTIVVERRAPPAPHVCSDACNGEELCPRARALLEAATSEEAASLIIAAFSIWALGGHGTGDCGDPFFRQCGGMQVPLQVDEGGARVRPDVGRMVRQAGRTGRGVRHTSHLGQPRCRRRVCGASTAGCVRRA